MRYVAMLPNTGAEWWNPDLDVSLIQGLVPKGSTPEVDGVSVFRAESDIVEAYTCAGCLARRGIKSADQVYAIRFLDSDLTIFPDVSLVQDPGDIGVKSIDDAHFNIMGTKDKLEALARHVRTDLHKGADRLRRVSKAQVTLQLKLMLDLAVDVAITGPAKARAYKALGLSVPVRPGGGTQAAT